MYKHLKCINIVYTFKMYKQIYMFLRNKKCKQQNFSNICKSNEKNCYHLQSTY